jgi:hypothetical protein
VLNLNARDIASNLGRGPDISIHSNPLWACVVHSAVAVHNTGTQALRGVREVPMNQPRRKYVAVTSCSTSSSLTVMSGAMIAASLPPSSSSSGVSRGAAAAITARRSQGHRSAR